MSACGAARRGAAIAGQAITDLLLDKGDRFLAFAPQQTAELALSHILYRLQRQADADGRDVADYASTIASVLVDKRRGRMLCFGLGDSLILAAGQGRCCTLVQPDLGSGGCCVTTTRNAAARTTVRLLDTAKIEHVVICSDGAWRPMFARGRIRPEAEALLVGGDFDGLAAFLTAQDCFDDHSFVSLAIHPRSKRRSA